MSRTGKGGRGDFNLLDDAELIPLLKSMVDMALINLTAIPAPSGIMPVVIAAGRRQSYAHLPMPRMTNTFIRNGEYDPQEIISTVKKGLYLADLGSGQVDTVSGQYSFQTALAYLIEDGKITAAVKGATLTGNGPDTLKNISMVGNNLELDRGNAICGKSGQSVPVCVGQPTLKMDELLVGGTGG